MTQSQAGNVRGRKDATVYFRRINKSRPLWEQELAVFVEALDN
jgi:hypothetical protein